MEPCDDPQGWNGARTDLRNGEGDADDTHEKVAGGQRGDEEVGDRAQLAVTGEDEQNQTVADQAHHQLQTQQHHQYCHSDIGHLQ